MSEHYEVRAGLAEVEEFNVLGISIVTDNEKATDDINALWERFFSGSIGQHIPDKVDDTIYAVYSDYEGNHEAPYRPTIGYRVSKAPKQLGHNTYCVPIVNGTYALMSAAGKQPQALLETWEAIWSSDIDRAFATDFEVYGPRFFEDGINEVLIHVGVKE